MEVKRESEIKRIMRGYKDANTHGELERKRGDKNEGEREERWR